MKKTYVKPTAECEEFVANEFVAACWLVTCVKKPGHESHGSFIYSPPSGKAPNADLFDQDGDGFAYYVIPNYGNSYKGTINGEWGLHPVEWEMKGKGNGANSSN